MSPSTSSFSIQHSGAPLVTCEILYGLQTHPRPKKPRAGTERGEAEARQRIAGIAVSLSLLRDIVDLAAIEVKSDFPSPAFESSRRRFSSFAHGSLPTPLPATRLRLVPFAQLSHNGLRFNQGRLLSLSLSRERSRSRNERVNYEKVWRVDSIQSDVKVDMKRNVDRGICLLEK